MSDFSAFMAGNCAKVENRKVVISNRFKDEKGNPIEWEIRAISSDENDQLIQKFMVNMPVVGKRGQYTRQLDQVKYAAAFVASAVVYPDLENAALQDSYGVKTPEALLKKMLYMGEETRLAQIVKELAQVEELDELVDEAKN